MLAIVAFITAGAVYVEARILRSLPWLRRFLASHPLFALAFSLLLSLVLGSLFGAAGTMVFAAGVVSTVIMQPVYRVRGMAQRHPRLGRLLRHLHFE